VVIETPELGHATYVFAKPESMPAFLADYAGITKEDILTNRSNVAERLGYLGRVVHGANPRGCSRRLRHTSVKRQILLSCDASRKAQYPARAKQESSLAASRRRYGFIASRMSVGGSAVGLPSPLNAAPRRGVNPHGVVWPVAKFTKPP